MGRKKKIKKNTKIELHSYHLTPNKTNINAF